MRRLPLSHQRLSSTDQSRCVQARAVHCYLVGAGLGPSDYLTLKAARLISQCDVLIYDDLGTEDALFLAKKSCRGFYVGKRGGKAESMKQSQINELLVKECLQLRKGDDSEEKCVVRLKGGDPGVFGRLNPELTALQGAGIDYTLVPGISSVLAAPLLAGLSLTDVQSSRSFLVTSGHDVGGLDFASFQPIPTLVFVMGGRNLGLILSKLVSVSRRSKEDHVTIVKNAGREDQKMWRGTIATIEEMTNQEDLSPCVIVVGEASGKEVKG